MSVSTLITVVLVCGMAASQRPPEADDCKIVPINHTREPSSYSLFERGPVFRKGDSKIHVKIVPEAFCETDYLRQKLCKPNADQTGAGVLKTHRPLGALRMLQSDLESCQVGTACKLSLSGWDAYKDLELISIDCGKDDKEPAPVAQAGVEHINHLSQDRHDCEFPRATFRLPGWHNNGWKESSPGFVFWYTPEALLRKAGSRLFSSIFGYKAGSRLLVGEEILNRNKAQQPSPPDSAQPPLDHKVTKVHMFKYRYYVDRESLSMRDKLTWHVGVLLEWDHSKFTTVVEVGHLHGLGGRVGSSYYPDAKESPTELYETIRREAPGMVQPWDESKAEFRVLDVEPKSKYEFLQYMEMEDNKNRYHSPSISWSKGVTSGKTRREVLNGLLNYAAMAPAYKAVGGRMRNCQTLGVDLIEWLTGDSLKVPTKALLVFGHNNHPEYFTTARDSVLLRRQEHKIFD